MRKYPEDLFEEPGTDEFFNIIRDGGSERLSEARIRINNLWAKTRELLDPNFHIQFRVKGQYQARVWELILGGFLLESGLELKSNSGAYGPDYTVHGQPPIWIEAIAPKAGIGRNEVPDLSNSSTPTQIPDEKITQRLVGAFSEKFKKFEKYHQKNTVTHEDPCVIAISGSIIPSAILDSEPPRIIRTLLPFGGLALKVSPDGSSKNELCYEYQDAIVKENGQELRTDWFCRKECEIISAVIYSNVDELDPDPFNGCYYQIAYNPLARNPLPNDWLPKGRAYWVEGGNLEHDFRC